MKLLNIAFVILLIPFTASADSFEIIIDLKDVGSTYLSYSEISLLDNDDKKVFEGSTDPWGRVDIDQQKGDYTLIMQWDGSEIQKKIQIDEAGSIKTLRIAVSILDKQKIKQNHIKRLESDDFEGILSVYAGGISKTGLDRVIIFKFTENYKNIFSEKEEISKSLIQKKLNPKDIVLDQKLNKNEGMVFMYNKKNYLFKITDIDWSFWGYKTDKLNFEIIQIK